MEDKGGQCNDLNMVDAAAALMVLQHNESATTNSSKDGDSKQAGDSERRLRDNGKGNPRSGESPLDASTDSKRYVGEPTEFDVLLGRGKGFQRYEKHSFDKTGVVISSTDVSAFAPLHRHKGNIRLHRILQTYTPRYIAGNRKEKTKVSDDIVKLIQSFTGRFLKREEDSSNVWVVVPDGVARQKVAHAIRDGMRTSVDPGSKSSAAKMESKEVKVVQDVPARSAQPNFCSVTAEQVRLAEMELAHQRAIQNSFLLSNRSHMMLADTRAPLLAGHVLHEMPQARPLQLEILSQRLAMEAQSKFVNHHAIHSTKRVVGKVVNLEDIPPDLLRSSQVFVTFLS